MNKFLTNNKPFFIYFFSLLPIFSFIKVLFYWYNKPLLTETTSNSILSIMGWSIFYDSSIIIAFAFLFFLLLTVVKKNRHSFYTKTVVLFFTIIVSLSILLNIIDVFYYPFVQHKANKDLLYVVSSPLDKLKNLSLLWTVLSFCIAGLVAFCVHRFHKKLSSTFFYGKDCKQALIISAIMLVSIVLLYKKTYSYLLPNYALTKLSNKKATIVQNSFSTFIYSLLQKGENLPTTNYLTQQEYLKQFSITKQIQSASSTKKNIVLFIMESVPYDFFDSSNIYFTTLPFFNSLLQKSNFFNNAYCYSHESNKGITAILGGVPTITDVPLYNSSYINLPLTKIGEALSQQGYRSFFCIGDNYDDFGFAKCTNWLGINNYYSKENISNYKNLPSSAMGVHDEFVLEFMQEKIKETTEPFFATNYNISTHYDYELPKTFTKVFDNTYSTAMKSMVYYDYALGKFFDSIKNEKWYNNTLFVFCSDHWMYPNEKSLTENNVANYKIPIIIFDPTDPTKKIINSTASQFDVMPTILGFSGYNKKIISYGRNLLDSSNTNSSIAFSKIGNGIYQLIEDDYVLGFNTNKQQVDYYYNFKKDSLLKNNLVAKIDSTQQKMETKIKVILQTATEQYKGRLFN